MSTKMSQIAASGLFKYVWHFIGHQALKKANSNGQVNDFLQSFSMWHKIVRWSHDSKTL